MSCKLEIRLAVPDDYHYEPQEVLFAWGPDAYRDYKRGQRRRIDRQASDTFSTSAAALNSTSQSVYDNESSPWSRRQRTEGAEY